MPWLPTLQDALLREYHDRPRVASLATVDDLGAPRVRSVIVRWIEDDGTIGLASDVRSAKNDQLRARPRAELALWLPTLREQFRIAGEVAIVDASSGDRRREALWAALSPPSRALFFWPAPGRSRDPDPTRFPVAIEGTETAPASFTLLVLHPEQVEFLQLAPLPHRRRRWRATTGWQVEELNP